MAKPLLSVVVPTKDRYKYLKHLIKLIQSYNSDEWEIVVQDNTDDNTEILEFLKEINYSGCKYFHEKGQLPMTTNADKAILHSEGEYVCFLGDDDGVCPNALDYCRLMRDNCYEALRSNLADYYWPDAVSSFDGVRGKVIKPKVTGAQMILSTEDVLMDVINRGFVDRGNLPSVYHGIVSRKALDRVYEKCQTFFPGQSPDISSGIAVALVMKSFLMVDDVVTISGASAFHGGKTVGMNKRYPQISDMVWFRPNAEKIWDARLPKIAVGSIIWAESSIETLRNMGREDLINKVDFEVIYKEFVVYFFPIRSLVYELSSNKRKLILYEYLYFVVRVWKAIFRRIKIALGITDKNVIVEKNLECIQECVSFLTNEQR